MRHISIYEKSSLAGTGMPYSPMTTDIYHLANISSEEIPTLLQTFASFLRKQSAEKLHSWNIDDLSISDQTVYSRIALGHYFADQFRGIIALLIQAGLDVEVNTCQEIIDIKLLNQNSIRLIDVRNQHYLYTTVVVASGHLWKSNDAATKGYYSSPWPIHKVLTRPNAHYNHEIGILGSSLSAFDVVTSLSHRHGTFSMEDDKMKFTKWNNAQNFKLILYSADGLLPHLQYIQRKPRREIYRHFNPAHVSALIDDHGFLSLDRYFDTLCRQPLIASLILDGLHETAKRLAYKSFSIVDFANVMSSKHQYVDSFQGMKFEYALAKHHINTNTPIHWMETFDDLMYSLNFHAEYLSAEDHVSLNTDIMPFLMNVIAALPLESASILLALYDANCIEIRKGTVKINDNALKNRKTEIRVEFDNGDFQDHEYKLFIDSGGVHKIGCPEYPFQTLVNSGDVSKASLRRNSLEPTAVFHSRDQKLQNSIGAVEFTVEGIRITKSYRTVNSQGVPNSCLFDINFNHALGFRPYSYGLQACNETSSIAVTNWVKEIQSL